MLITVNQKKNVAKKEYNKIKLPFALRKKKNIRYKPWWFPHRSRFLKKRNKFYLNWKKNKVFKKYKFFFKCRKRQIFKIKLKKIFNSTLLVKNLFKKIYGLKRNKDFLKLLSSNYTKFFQNLENRLDVIISKNMNIRNIKQSQQIIKAGLVFLNNKKVYQFNAIVKPLDVIYLERDGFPWKIRNMLFRKKRKKKSFNNYVSRSIPLIINFKTINYKYALPTKFLNKKTFKLLSWHYR